MGKPSAMNSILCRSRRGRRRANGIGEGFGTIYSSVSQDLTGLNGTAGKAGPNIEAIRLTGGANITAYGGSGGDFLYGNDGNDILAGREGADLMAGGKGDDIYAVDNVGDRLIEKAGEGRDTVNSTVDYSAARQSIEIIVLKGVGAIGAIGSADSNTITGNEGGNRIDGGDGDDILSGRLGNDVLTGGSGADLFVFDTPRGYSNIDEITDLVSGVDHIGLSQRAYAQAASASSARTPSRSAPRR
jgi:Ca2+-binding RTX toxin-like protein